MEMFHPCKHFPVHVREIYLFCYSVVKHSHKWAIIEFFPEHEDFYLYIFVACCCNVSLLSIVIRRSFTEVDDCITSLRIVVETFFPVVTKSLHFSALEFKSVHANHSFNVEVSVSIFLSVE